MLWCQLCEACCGKRGRRRRCRSFWDLLRKGLSGGILIGILILLRRQFPHWGGPKRRPARRAGAADSQPVSADVYRRPDPLIYDQYYLMAQGLGVTWDNPDIRVEQGGQPVDPHDLAPDTTYDVVARIWNGSADAPVAGLPVHFSYLSFGIGTESHGIGVDDVDLGAKGSPDCPAYASCPWTTPSQAGHYCLRVELRWFDDANPANNLGQQNTDVQPLNSPRAQFSFALANRERAPVDVTLRADGYALPELEPCEDGKRATVARRARLAAQRADAQGVPDGWSVEISPSATRLEPKEETTVTVDVTAPDGFSGAQPLNVNAFADGRILGGVTLTASS